MRNQLAPYQKQRLSTSDYILALASFIPGLGVLFGIISINSGVARKSKFLKITGGLGILFSVILAIALYVGLNQVRTKLFETSDNWNVFNRNNLNKLFIYTEYYKLQNGIYPDSLAELKRYDDFLPLREVPHHRVYHYEKITDSTYHLLGMGTDGMPFTADDVYPSLAEGQLVKNGLLMP